MLQAALLQDERRRRRPNIKTKSARVKKMMLIKPKLVLVVLAMLFFISNMASAEDSLEKEEAVDTYPTGSDDQLEEEKASDEMKDNDQLQEKTKMEDDQELADPESPEMKAVVQQPSEDEAGKRGIRIRCYCWIGWVKKKSRKYINYGCIRKFRLIHTGKQRKCSASCSKKCAPGLKKKYYLCKKIGKKYHYKWHKVGCFSQVGKWDLPNNLWDFDGSPHGLCCKKFRRSCKSVYGKNFKYHNGMKLCVKYIAPGPILGIPNGTVKPPVCLYANILYSCQKPKYIARPVTCW